jgi:hypothetical protein
MFRFSLWLLAISLPLWLIASLFNTNLCFESGDRLSYLRCWNGYFGISFLSTDQNPVTNDTASLLHGLALKHKRELFAFNTNYRETLLELSFPYLVINRALPPSKLSPAGPAFFITAIALPFWPLVFLSFTLLLWHFAFRRKPHPPWLCSNCRYDLTGNTTGRCPECGTLLPSASQPTRPNGPDPAIPPE